VRHAKKAFRAEIILSRVKNAGGKFKNPLGSQSITVETVMKKKTKRADS
jgi:hypothetical protein